MLNSRTFRTYSEATSNLRSPRARETTLTWQNLKTHDDMLCNDALVQFYGSLAGTRGTFHQQVVQRAGATGRLLSNAA